MINIFISVIVPVYNVEKYLSNCIKSIINQTFTKFELILIDDGSTDNCPRICDMYAKKDSRITVIHKRNGGLSSARNRGLDIAQGNYIAFIDSDDYVHKDFLKIMYMNIIKGNVDIVCCDYKEVYKHSQVDKDIGEYYIKELSNIEAINLLYSFSHDNIRICVWNKLYKKSLFIDLRFNENRKTCEDLEFIVQILFKANNIKYLKTELIYYYLNPTGLTSAMYLNDDYFEVSEFIKQFYLIRDLNEAYNKHLLWELKSIIDFYYNSDITRKRNLKDLYNSSLKNYKKTYKLKLLSREKFELFLFYHSPWLYNFCRKCWNQIRS